MTEQLVSLKTKSILHDKGFFNGGFNIDIRPTSNLPTQSLVQKWLREVHNIHIEIYYNASGCGWILTKLNGSTIKDIDNDIFFDTYEYSLEQGIIEALKLIK